MNRTRARISPAMVKTLYAAMEKTGSLLGRNGWTLLVAAIALLGVTLRVWGLGHGVPEGLFHIDAQKQYEAVWHFLKGEYTFDIDYYMSRLDIAGFPLFSMHIPEFVLRFAMGVSNLMALPFFPDDKTIVMTCRWLNVLYSLVMIVLTYKTGARLGEPRAGALAAFFLAVSLVHVQSSKYILGDVPMSMFALIAVYVSLGALRAESNGHYAAFGFFTGLSAASKYNGVLMFVFLALLFWHLHPRRADFVRHSGKLALALSVCVITFVIVNPGLLADPHKAVQAIIASSAESAYINVPDQTFFGKFAALLDQAGYNAWVVSGLLAPIPVWVAVAAIIVTAFAYTGRLSFVWATPILIFIAGKIAMPASAPSHFLNILPLVLLAVAIGLDTVAKKIKIAGTILTTALAIYSLHVSLQDASTWSLRPLHLEYNEWMSENIDPEAAKDWVETSITFGESEAAANPFKHFHYAAPRAVTLHRFLNYRLFLKTDTGAPPLFPPVHYIAHKERGIIFPAYNDFATTLKAFVTGHRTALPRGAVRQIVVERNMERLAVWVRNFSTKPNPITLSVGGHAFERTLDPNEARFIVIDHPQRSYFYYGGVITLRAASVYRAGWSMGVTEKDIGDLYMASGGAGRAVGAYRKAGDPYSLLNVLAYADSVDTRNEARRELDRVAPGLLDAEPSGGNEFWRTVAGYDDTIFASRMARPIEYRHSNNAHIRPSGWIIQEGGELYGPYTTLLKGNYKVSARITARDGLDSFTFDVVSMLGKKTLFARTVSVRERTGRTDATVVFPFEITAPMESPVEFRFRNVNGGSLVVDAVTLTADYRSSVADLVVKARSALAR